MTIRIERRFGMPNWPPTQVAAPTTPYGGPRRSTDPADVADFLTVLVEERVALAADLEGRRVQGVDHSSAHPASSQGNPCCEICELAAELRYVDGLIEEVAQEFRNRSRSQWR